MTDQFAGVARNGKLILDFPDHVKAWMKEHEGKRVVLSLEVERLRRGLQANRYHFGVVVPAFQEIWSKGRTALGLPPYTKLETHSVLVQVLVGWEEGPVSGSRLPKATRTMKSDEFARFVSDARHMALHDYGLVIPEPGEL